MSRHRSVGFAALTLLVPCGLAAETPVIEHQKIKCIVAEKYPRMDASFTPDEIGQARVFFKPEGIPTWYYVKMTRASKGWEGVLPKPKRQMIGKKIIYYLEATAKDMEQGTTEETDPRVVARKDDCGNEPMAAWSAKPPVGVFPSVPAGFSTGAAVGTGAFAGAGIAVAGGVTVLATRGSHTSPPSAPEPVPPTPPSPPPSPVPPSPPPPSVESLDVSCQVEPSAGGSPLTVKFRGFATGGTGVYDFLWAFGDGETSTQPNPSHTYANPGSYTAVLTVTSGDQSRSCDKRITVEKPCTAIAGPTTAITSPGPSRTPLSGTVSVQASASGPAGIARVQFFEGSTLIGTDDTAPYAVSWRTPAGCGSFELTSRAVDNCSKEASSSPVGVSVDNDSAPPTVSNIDPPNDFNETAPPLAVSADASDDTGIDRVEFNLLFIEGCEGSLQPLAAGSDSSAPYSVNLDFTFPPNEGCFMCAELHVQAFDTCGKVSDVVIVGGGISNPSPSCQGIAAPAAKGVKKLRPAQPAPGQSASWVSQLEAPGALGQAVLNKETLVLAATGLSHHTARARHGENRIEAQLVRGSGQSGVWRFDFSGIEGFEAGSLRVVEGEVALLTDRAVAFRLKGQAGERVSFTFRVQ